DYSALAGLVISIKEYRDKLNQYYEENRNLILSGRHSASIAHDIRSLNIGVAGFLNLVLNRLGETQEGTIPKVDKRGLIMARDNSRQIENLLKNFSMFNRSELIIYRDTDLVKVVRDKLNSLKSRVDYERKFNFDLDVPQGDSGLLVDADWFSTVIENLVKNSIEACEKNCHISVKIIKTCTKVVLTFEDNSGGIPADLLPHIFNPFVSSKKRGQGLGLANARKVVEDQEGEISVKNKEGRGAVFTIEFPLSP
ncbi:MAG TPA: HAMP domain-containing histidine kinase, partial [Candidatus Aminicenantes bacterium]|nr:HAMP domain-containing histidine kinase [Candidatus Aminicenantes bacterium]